MELFSPTVQQRHVFQSGQFQTVDEFIFGLCEVAIQKAARPLTLARHGLSDFGRCKKGISLNDSCSG